MAAERGQNRGSGTSAEDPFRLDAMHPVAGELSEIAIISQIFGKENHDWFHHQYLSHANNIREWQIRLNSGQIRKVFFDESRFTDSIPVPDKVREILEEAAAKRAVPDATLVSRFPLIEVRAKTAADAGRIVLTHIKKAQSQGWKKGNMHGGVDGWRFDQELFRGSEKTTMMFDMRPARVHIRGIDLAVFCGLDSFEAIDQLERRVGASVLEYRPASTVPFVVTLRNVFSKRNLKLSALVGAVSGAMMLFAGESIMAALIMGLLVPFAMNLLVFIKVRTEISRIDQKRPDRSDPREIGDRIVQPDALLAAVIGPAARSRTAITEAFWDYINQHGLQDQENRATINADEKLLPIFNGKKAVTMVEMVKLLSNHLR